MLGLFKKKLNDKKSVKVVDIANATRTITFNNAKLSSVNISKSAEGAVKADITVVCPDEPA